RGVRLQTEDISAKLRYVLSTRILDPQFQGQVKEKLTSRDALKLVAQVIRDPLEVWLNAHVDYGKRIAELAIQQALTRMKSAQKVEKRKGSGVAVLPGKLTDCESDDIAVAIGVDPHHSSAEADLKGLRYSKIIIMADADVDGSHIKVLLLTLFFR